MYDLNNDFSSPIESKDRRNTYSGTFKARVVCEFINKKRSLKELAEFYNVHPNQIKNWKSQLLKGASYVLDDKRTSRYQPEKLRKRPVTQGNEPYGKSS